MTQRGATAMDIALADENFLAEPRHSRSRPAGRPAADRDLCSSRAGTRSRRRAMRRRWLRKSPSSLGNAIGLNETATLLEFTSAAAGGLDHYSSFLTADQLRDIYSQIEGNFVGLGVELKADQGALLIVHVIPHSPAEQVGHSRRRSHHGGRRPGDASRCRPTRPRRCLTGAEGSMVRVTVNTPARRRARLTVRRASVDVPSLEDVKIRRPGDGRGVRQDSGVPEDDAGRFGTGSVGPASARACGA